MIYTEKKPLNEILQSLGKDKNIFLLSCNGCCDAAATGGEVQTLQMKKQLQQANKIIVGWAVVDFLCNKLLAALKLIPYKDKINQADSILVMSCGIGVQSVAKALKKAVHPALDTISLGGFQGLWPSEERCEQCGDCILDITGGICPVASCSKGLLNGPCGGAKDGKCEVDQEKECGWQLIYERLKDIGRLDNLKQFRGPRNYQKMLPSAKLRRSHFYDIENTL